MALVKLVSPARFHHISHAVQGVIFEKAIKSGATNAGLLSYTGDVFLVFGFEQ
jgi:hypothetical protein